MRALTDGYRRASEQVGERVDPRAIGGSILDFRCAGEQVLRSVMPAFAHLPKYSPDEAPPGVPALRLAFWDSAGSGVAPMSALPETGTAETVYFLSADVRIALSASGDLCAALDSQRRTGVVWMRDSGRVAGFERAAPARVILHWWFAELGAQLVHAAAVALNGEAVLLAGRSGSGKSTSSLACMAAGFEFLGDDYCLVTLDPVPGVHGLFGSAKLSFHHLRERLPELAPAIANAAELGEASDDKAVLFPGDHMPGRIGTSRPVKAIVIPRVSENRVSSLRPVSGMHALKALAPSSLLQMPGLKQHALSQLAQLARTIPSYELALGRELDSVPATLRTLWG